MDLHRFRSLLRAGDQIARWQEHYNTAPALGAALRHSNTTGRFQIKPALVAGAVSCLETLRVVRMSTLPYSLRRITGSLPSVIARLRPCRRNIAAAFDREAVPGLEKHGVPRDPPRGQPLSKLKRGSLADQ